jgi:hypothetical protein
MNLRTLTIFWNVDCSLTEGYKASSLMIEAVGTSETLTNFYQTKRCKIPENIIYTHGWKVWYRDECKRGKK